MTLGIDIGGTNICLGLVRDAQVIRRISAPSFAPGAGLEETLEYLSAQIGRILTPGTRKIGIGVPSVLDVESGVVYDATNIPSWKEVPLKAWLEERFSLPVAVNNDANCYALGAYGLYPKEARPEVLVGITLGTGVGMGIVIGGKLFCGTNCGAGELCCLPYREGIIEDFTSKKFFTARGTTPLEASRRALAGEEKALALFEEFGHHLGALIQAALLSYDPGHIAIGGGIAQSFPLFHPAVMEKLRKDFPYRKALAQLDIRPVTGDDVQLVGASLL